MIVIAIIIISWTWFKVIKYQRKNPLVSENNTTSTTTTTPFINNNASPSSTINSNNIPNNELPPEYTILYDNQTGNIPPSTSQSINTVQHINNQPSINYVSKTLTVSSNNIANNVGPEYRTSYHSNYSITNIPSSTLNNQSSFFSPINTQPYISNNTDKKISENNDDIFDAYTCDDTNSVINSNNINNKNIKNNKDDIKISKDIKSKNNKDDIKTLKDSEKYL